MTNPTPTRQAILSRIRGPAVPPGPFSETQAGRNSIEELKRGI